MSKINKQRSSREHMQTLREKEKEKEKEREGKDRKKEFFKLLSVEMQDVEFNENHFEK